MTVDIKSEEGQLIRQLIPLSTLPLNQFESLCTHISVESAEKGFFLFKKDDADNALIYLIDGSVTLQSGQLEVESIEAGTESSRFALAHQIPRKIDAYSNTPIRFLKINADLINTLPSVSYQEENNYMVIDEHEDEDSDDDWMTTLLKTPIFKALPPSNLQRILMSLEEVKFKKGEVIVKQGEPGDYYYLIKKGHCLLSRKPSENAKEIKLAQLRTQDTFGEDSLLSGSPRNVTITALTDIKLLRLSKENFINLIKEPAIKFIDYTDIQQYLDNGAVLLDVRSPDSYKEHHIPNSINAPFFSLRMFIKTYDKKKDALVLCENGKTSEAAAFLLLRQKINALVIKGGMESIPEDAIKPTAAFVIDDGIETLNTQLSDVSQSTEEQQEPPEKEQEAIAEEAHEKLETLEFDLSADEGDYNDELNPLHLENQQLKQTIDRLTKEKSDLERRYRMLYRQAEKLKVALDALRKKQENT